MEKIYAELIKKGIKTIEEVPDKLRDAVEKILKDQVITYVKKHKYVIGKIKEPIVNELSAEEVRKILNLHTNKPNTTIWNNQDAEMQITYAADTKTYIDNKMAELQALLLEKGEQICQKERRE